MMPRPKTRTYATTTYYADCGVVREVARHTVTLTRDAAGTLTATVDGQPTPTAEAVRILTRADERTITHEAYLTIGKPAACALHRELARMGYRSHYTLAGDALGRAVDSLAGLTADEAACVRSYAYGQFGMVG